MSHSCVNATLFSLVCSEITLKSYWGKLQWHECLRFHHHWHVSEAKCIPTIESTIESTIELEWRLTRKSDMFVLTSEFKIEDEQREQQRHVTSSVMRKQVTKSYFAFCFVSPVCVSSQLFMNDTSSWTVLPGEWYFAVNSTRCIASTKCFDIWISCDTNVASQHLFRMKNPALL